jgi:hypothetical protein
VLRLYGIGVSSEVAAWLVDRLYKDAHAPAVSSALMIEKGIERELYAVTLTPDERMAILGVLDDPPAGLVELRARLLQDHSHPRGSPGTTPC